MELIEKIKKCEIIKIKTINKIEWKLFMIIYRIKWKIIF